MTNSSPIIAGVPWSVFISAVTVLIGLVVTALRMLYKSFQKGLEEKTAHNYERVAQLEKRINKCFEAHERLRDRWDEFLCEYLKIDSTRGQKVEALFSVVDQMQKSVVNIPQNMNERLEEAFARSMSELKLYVRELIPQEKSNDT